MTINSPWTPALLKVKPRARRGLLLVVWLFFMPEFVANKLGQNPFLNISVSFRTAYLLASPRGFEPLLPALKAGVLGRLDDGDYNYAIKNGGARRDRTADLNTASVALSQLSYGPRDNLCHSKKPRYFNGCLFFGQGKLTLFAAASKLSGLRETGD